MTLMLEFSPDPGLGSRSAPDLNCDMYVFNKAINLYCKTQKNLFLHFSLTSHNRWDLDLSHPTFVP